MLIAEVQKTGRLCGYIDADYTFNSNWAQTLGVAPVDLVTVQPQTAESAFEVVRTLMGTVSFWVIDPASALVTACEANNHDLVDVREYRRNLMTSAIRVLSAHAYRTNSTLLFISNAVHSLSKNAFLQWPVRPAISRILRYLAALEVELNHSGAPSAANRPFEQEFTVVTRKNKLSSFHKCMNLVVAESGATLRRC
jgi:recombination protein RecA